MIKLVKAEGMEEKERGFLNSPYPQVLVEPESHQRVQMRIVTKVGEAFWEGSW